MEQDDCHVSSPIFHATGWRRRDRDRDRDGGGKIEADSGSLSPLSTNRRRFVSFRSVLGGNDRLSLSARSSNSSSSLRALVGVKRAVTPTRTRPSLTKVTVHIRRHTGEKPFRCVCGYKTADKGHLTDHLRRMEVLEPRVHSEVSHSTSKDREPGAAQAEGHPHKRLRTQ